MLPAAEETLVLKRAVEIGELSEAEIPPETSSVPQGTTLRFGRRLDRLITRGRISEQRVLQLLREIRTESVSAGATILPQRKQVRRELGIDVTMLPEEPPGSTESSSATIDPEASIGDQLSAERTVDGSLVGYKGPPAGNKFPVESWDRYEFHKLLGQGGMGAVYKAKDKRLGRLVALKFIRGGDEQMTHRFMQEARAQSRLDHPNICHVYEVGEVAGKAYIAMQLVDGDSLEKARPDLSLLNKVAVMRDVCLAMHHAHEKGVIHRDIKPSNIMIEKRSDGSVVPVVMDFGLAREAGDGKGLTESGAVMGTPAFMSPEQARGEARHLDRRSDVYSLGATLFDVLCGHAPFESETVIDVILSVMNEEAPLLRSIDPQLPEALEVICARCLTKDKEQRYATALALAEDLTRFLHSEKIVAKKISLLYRLRWRARQNKPAAALVLSLLLSMVLFAGYGIRQSYVARKQSELQRQIAQDSKDLEWMVRTAYALPLHNVEREQSLLQKRMQQVEQKLRSYGDLAAGLGHYALGRGHLSLHEYKAARTHLEQAQRLGEQGPELQAALGRVLGELYHEALLEARRSGEKSWVAQRQKELEKQLLQPAARLLQQALSRRDSLSLDSPEYIEGLLDFYAGRLVQADQKAQRALEQTPWLAEAAKLRGEIAHEQGLSKISDGKHDEARQLLAQAIAHYQSASDISRSNGFIYAALARAYMDLSEVDRFQGKSQEQSFAQAKIAAEHIVTTLPSANIGYVERGRVLYFQGRALQRTGKDPVDLFNQAISDAEQSVAKKPTDVIGWDLLGLAYFSRGLRDSGKGINPTQSWNIAEKSFEKALLIAPKFPWAFNDLGNYYWAKANYDRNHGINANHHYQKSIQQFQTAIQIDPRYQFASGNAIGALVEFSDYLQEHGEDFSSLVSTAEALFHACGSGCSEQITAQRNMATAYLTLAQHEVRKEADPREALTKARHHLDEMRRLVKSTYWECLFSRYADTFESEYLIHTKTDPSHVLQSALTQLQTCKEFDTQAEDPYILEARLSIAQAHWMESQGKPAQHELSLALAAARKAVALNGESTEAAHERARACHRLARISKGIERTTLLSEGLQAVEQGLSVKADSGPLLAMKAVLLSAQGRSEPDEAARAQKERLAQASWDKALSINPLLSREYGQAIHAK
ncbi:MAG: protein kinase [Myxococcales bacterium]|nr:protein kinase [Myxococcales bacterium]